MQAGALGFFGKPFQRRGSAANCSNGTAVCAGVGGIEVRHGTVVYIVVYIVDDDLAVCSALQPLIRSVVLEAETFTSARDFLDAKHIDGPGCVVLDVPF